MHSLVSSAKFFDTFAFPSFTVDRLVRAGNVVRALQERTPISDWVFDEIYPKAVQSVSALHWSPVRVCERVVSLLRLTRGDRLLDVGAGVGKLCIVAAAMTGAFVCGVERQPYLADVARKAVKRFGVSGVSILTKSFDLATEDPNQFDAAYLFNPFTESLVFPGVGDLALTVPGWSRELARLDVLTAQSFLSRARVGMRVVTYCGFGGALPPDYECMKRECFDGGSLELWEKR